MWIYLPDCHVSIVADSTRAGWVLVRARLRGDLERFASPQAWEIEETPDADYRWRVFIPREALSRRLQQIAYSLDWPNVKSAIASGDTLRWAWYSKAWCAGLNAQMAEEHMGRVQPWPRQNGES